MLTTGLDVATQRLRFLAEASRVLAESLDYQATLKSVARLAVPDICDWCVVDVLQTDGTLARVAIAHRDPVRHDLARRLQQCFPPHVDATSGPANVVRTGRTEFEAHLVDPILHQIAPEPERVSLLTRLGMNSYLSVPLTTRDRILGSITLFTEAARTLDSDDVFVAEDLARRAATAIDNARLYDEAQRAVRSRDDMLAVVTHDLRTPLGAIIAASTLQMTPAAADGNRWSARAATIQRSAKHMARLIRDLTDLGQIDAGRFAIEWAVQDPTLLVQDVIDTLQSVAIRRNARMDADLVGMVPWIACDGDRVIQVLSNLAGNALKVGASTVTIRLEVRGTDVLFAVSDNGPGISPEDLPYLFDRYWRAPVAHYRGTGARASDCEGHHRRASRPDLGRKPAWRRDAVLLHAAAVVGYGSSFCNGHFAMQGRHPWQSSGDHRLAAKRPFEARRQRSDLCPHRGMGIVNVIRRLRDEFSALPGLRLTQAQVERLCAADESTVASALCALVSADFLTTLADGSFGRTDIWADVRPRQARSRREPKGQRILEHENVVTQRDAAVLRRRA